MFCISDLLKHKTQKYCSCNILYLHKTLQFTPNKTLLPTQTEKKEGNPHFFTPSQEPEQNTVLAPD
jgi:hypothetical protein